MSLAVMVDAFGAARVSLHPISEQRAEVRVSGTLPVVWPEYFAAALAPHSIAIRQGEAERHIDGWNARFEIEGTLPDCDLTYLNLSEILNTLPPSRQARAISVLHYGLVRLKDALRLAIQAQDHHGLLADVLFKLKQWGLYAKRITVDSDARTVTQCFWLTSFVARAPDDQAERQLRDFLLSARILRPT